ncbi:NAD(P)/FAD-dependent oxidoreductase [Patescibacteria group bacterium]
MYDLAILGGGPAGVAAGIYASRKKLKTVFITDKFEGQSTVSPDIQNWIGDISISGKDLSKKLENHLKAYSGEIVDIKENEKVISVKKNESDDVFEIKTENESYIAKTILVATGSHRRKLTMEGANEFEHKGITYCASCDGPLFTNKDVIVIGGGNAGFETASQLLAYTKSVTLLQRSDKFNADPVTVKKVTEHPNMTAILNTETTEIKGESFVKSLVYKDTQTGEEKEIKTDGIFVEIGNEPNTDFVEGLVELTKYKQIIVDPKNQKTKTEGIWAAGDCTDALYHQNNIAVGDAVKALEDIYLYLKAK